MTFERSGLLCHVFLACVPLTLRSIQVGCLAPHCLRGVHVTWENPSRLQLFLAFVFQKLERLRESKVLAEYKKDKRGSEKAEWK